MNQLPAGVPAPDFELNDIQGRRHRLGAVLKDGPAIFLFYKSSCPTSAFTLPYLQKITAGVGLVQGCVVWAISQDDVDETRVFANENGFEFTFLVDEHPYPVSSAYCLEYVPSIFIVDRDGSIRLSDHGFSKAVLNEISRTVADSAGRPAMELFWEGDGLPLTRPG